jgi:hypothetical protein
MSRLSNKSVAEVLSPTNVSFVDKRYNDEHLALLERKITLATEGFTTRKFCELVLRDRTRFIKGKCIDNMRLYHSMKEYYL